MNELSHNHTKRVKSDLGLRVNSHQLNDPEVLAIFQRTGMLEPTSISNSPRQFFHQTETLSSVQSKKHSPMISSVTV